MTQSTLPTTPPTARTATPPTARTATPPAGRTTIGTSGDTATHRRPWRRQLIADGAYLATSFPLALVGFSVLVSLLSLGATLLITLVGLPILVLTLWCARGFALLE